MHVRDCSKMAGTRESHVHILDSSVPLAAITASIRAARHPGHDPARWALPLVEAADRVAGGAWQRVALDLDEAWTLWLPPHAGEPCHGDTMTLGDGRGMRLGDTVAWLEAQADAYAQANPSCWSRIVSARDGDWAPLVVAPFAVGDRTAPPAGTRTAGIVIDGLHRALGWGLRHARRPRATPVVSASTTAAGDEAVPVLEAFVPSDVTAARR